MGHGYLVAVTGSMAIQGPNVCVSLTGQLYIHEVVIVALFSSVQFELYFRNVIECVQ